MRTSNSRGGELRYPTENGGQELAAYVNFRKDSEHNYNIELHVPNLGLLQENKAAAAQDINDFFESARAEMMDALGLTDEEG